MHRSINQFIVFNTDLILCSKWPQKLQLLFVLSELTVVIGCVVDFYVPIYAKTIVDSLTETVENGTQNFRWDLVFIFVALKTLQGIGALSLITGLQQIIWLSLEQYIRHLIQKRFFRHVHSMSLNWMMHAKPGDVLGALERGTESITSTLEHLLYSVIPTLANIIIAIAYLFMKFGWIYSLIVAVQISLYIIFTAFIIENRSACQSALNEAGDRLRGKAMDSVLNYETVKCYGNEKFEKRRYFHSFRGVQSQIKRIGVLTSVSQTVQQAIICSGLLVCSVLLLSAIVKGDGRNELTPADYVLMTSYLAQLYGPLNYLAGYYRELRINITNAESMLKYFNDQPDISNSLSAKSLRINEGLIEFNRVSLVTGANEIILRDVSFRVAPKTTVAVVGSTGSGKTSITRLLLRLFDPTSGQVLIDGMNVKDVTLESLHKSIGIIPQDTALLNDTIRNNIRYGKPTASDHEVHLAASLAQIHERIMSFPDGYDTIVGKRGVSLSGGERQRIAISRAILKDPKILILDEATAALDATTEKCIQEVLKHFCRNRTCLLITHNLAPTVDADMILVVNNGQIVEKGSHSSLLKNGGFFATMWNNQRQATCKSNGKF